MTDPEPEHGPDTYYYLIQTFPEGKPWATSSMQYPTMTEAVKVMNKLGRGKGEWKTHRVVMIREETTPCVLLNKLRYRATKIVMTTTRAYKGKMLPEKNDIRVIEERVVMKKDEGDITNER